MNETVRNVVKDLASKHGNAVRHVYGAVGGYPRPCDRVARQCLLNVDASEVVMNSHRPLGHDAMTRLTQAIATHPQWLDADEYPGNIELWISANMGGWDSDDLLGRYLPEERAIEIYWLAIILTADANGWDYRELTRVVVFHAWAHALSHLGRDADDGQWNTDRFVAASETERGLVEGIAQYWTHCTLSGPSEKDNSLMRQFLALLKQQPAPYRAHIPWLDTAAVKRYEKSGIVVPTCQMNPPHPIREAVRDCVLDARRHETPNLQERFSKQFMQSGQFLDALASVF